MTATDPRGRLPEVGDGPDPALDRYLADYGVPLCPSTRPPHRPLLLGPYGELRPPADPRRLRATVTSLPPDDGSTVLVPPAPSGAEEHRVEGDFPQPPGEEYVVELPAPRPAAEPQLLPRPAAAPVAEAPGTPAPAVPPPAVAPAPPHQPDPAAEAPISRAPASAPEPAPMTGAEKQPAVSDDDLMADMQAILSGQKAWDPGSRSVQPVSPRALPAPAATSSAGKPAVPTGPDLPAPDSAGSGEIFSRIAQSMQYANAYDVGTLELERRFEDFDRMAELRTKATRAPAAPSAPAPAPGPAAFLEDLDAITANRFAPTSATAPPASAVRTPEGAAPPDAGTGPPRRTTPGGSSGCTPGALSLAIAYAPPLSSVLYDTGEHVIAAEQAFTSPLRVGQTPGVAFGYGELVAMPDLYGSVDELMRAPVAELTHLKSLIQRSAAYYRGQKADRSLDVSNEEWDTATDHRYLRLAEDNYEHFSPASVVGGASTPTTAHADNRSAWAAHHRRALQEARQASTAPGANGAVPEQPLITNAYGDHFLTDAFAAGHLINKDVVLAAFQSRFYSGGSSLTQTAEDFLGRVADEAFVGDVAAKFSELEPFDRPWVGPIHLPWRPNIDSTAMFRRMLVKAAEEEPGRIGNLVVKLLHDHLNEHGVTVVNAAGDPPWQLTGDGFLNPTTLPIMRRAVARSAQDVLDVATRQPGALVDAAAVDRVWRFVPQLPAASQQAVAGLVHDYTDPASRTLSSAAAALIRRQVDSLVQSLLRDHKLRRA